MKCASIEVFIGVIVYDCVLLGYDATLLGMLL
jgi:hypothetical protein